MTKNWAAENLDQAIYEEIQDGVHLVSSNHVLRVYLWDLALFEGDQEYSALAPVKMPLCFEEVGVMGEGVSPDVFGLLGGVRSNFSLIGHAAFNRNELSGFVCRHGGPTHKTKRI